MNGSERVRAWWSRQSRRDQVFISIALFVAVLVLVSPRATVASAGASATPTDVAKVTSVTATSAPAASKTVTAAAARQRVKVLSVTDGDTIRVSIDGKSVALRYIGIDTPEAADPRRSVQCFGAEASAANRRLVEGKMVELEKDVSETDMYDRLLRYVWVDGKMVNEELVRDGYAKSSSYPPDVKYQDRFRVLEAEARAKGVGLWAASACAVAPTPAPTPASTSAPTTTPSTTAPTAAPSPTVTITASRYGYVSASTLPGASCNAQARLPSGTISSDQDLKATKIAGASGAVIWDYGVNSQTKAGTGTHTVTCTLNGATRSASAAFTVN